MTHAVVADPGVRTENRLQQTRRCYTTACARPSLRWMLVGLTTGLISQQGFVVAVALYAHAQGGAAMVGAVALAQMGVAAAAAPLFGRQAQRRSSRTVLRGTAAAQALFMLLTAGAAAAQAPLAVVVALAVVAAVAAGAGRPVRYALIPWLATSPAELEASNVAYSLSDGLSFFAGPALAGLSVAVGGPAAAMAFAAAMGAAAGYAAHRLPVIAGATTTRAEGRLVDGFKALFRHAASLTTVSVTQTFVRGLLNVLIVTASLELLHTGESGVALLTALLGVGGVAGSLALAAASGGQHHAGRLAVALVVWGAPISLIGLVPTTVVTGAALLVIGVANVAVDVHALVLFQRLLPGDSAARSFASLECLMMLAVGTGSMAGGILTGVLGPRAALVVAGAVLPGMVILNLRSLLRLGSRLAESEDRTASVRDVESLAVLPLAAVDLLAGVGEEIEVAPGMALVEQGGTDTDVYVVVSGQASVMKDNVEVGSATRGQVIGEVAALYGVQRTATVVATEDFVVLRVPAPDYVAALASCQEAEQMAHAVADSYGTVR